MDKVPSQESKYKFGDMVKLPVMEGLDQVENWMVVRVEGDQVFLRSTLIESPDGTKISTLNDMSSKETVKMQGKIVSLGELRKYNN